MRTFDSQDEYDEWLEEVVQNRNESDPSEFDTVAETCITDNVEVGDEDTLLTSGAPYTGERTTPTEVLRWSYHYQNLQDEFRAEAVGALQADLLAAHQGHL